MSVLDNLSFKFCLYDVFYPKESESSLDWNYACLPLLIWNKTWASGLNPLQVALLVDIVILAGSNKTSSLHVSGMFAARYRHVRGMLLVCSIKKLEENQIITDVTWGTNKRTNKQTNTTTHPSDALESSSVNKKKKTKQAVKEKPQAADKQNTQHTHDFDAVYNNYPRKEGRKKGEQIFKREIKTLEDYQLLKTAIENYRIKTKDTEKQFIKQFGTFMNNWRDYVEREKTPYQEFRETLDPILAEMAATREQREKTYQQRRDAWLKLRDQGLLDRQKQEVTENASV